MNPTSFEIPKGQRQLFIDGHGVRSMENLTQILHQPSKKGAVLRPARGDHAMQTRSAPHWDPEREEFRLLAQMSWYRSADGLHWTKVPEELQPEGGKAEFHALRDDADPDPKRRYKGLTSHVINMDTGKRVVDSSERVDPEGKPWPGTRFERNLDFLVSADGFSWQRLDAAVSSFDEHNMSYDPVNGQYLLSFKKTGTYGRAHMISTSPDFQHWSDPFMAIQADDPGSGAGPAAHRGVSQILQRRIPPSLSKHTRLAVAERRYLQRRTVSLRGHIPRPPCPLLRQRCPLDQPYPALHLDRALVRARSYINGSEWGTAKPSFQWSPGDSGAYDLSKNLPPSYPAGSRGRAVVLLFRGARSSRFFPSRISMAPRFASRSCAGTVSSH